MKSLLIFVFVTAGALTARADKIALVQYNADLHFGDYQRNANALLAFADQAVQNGAKIIVFPEGSHYGYVGQRQYWCRPPVLRAGCNDVAGIAEMIPGGATSSAWQKYAQAHGVFILFNSPEVDGNDYFNTTAVFGPAGFVAKYRKRSLYVYDEFYALPGNLGPIAFDTPYGRFGLLICADANSASHFREYQRLGIQNVIVSMDWDQDPNGQNGARPARTFFQSVARSTGSTLFVSDVSARDGTGAYLPGARVRVRDGLPSVAIGVDGVTYFELAQRFR